MLKTGLVHPEHPVIPAHRDAAAFERAVDGCRDLGRQPHGPVAQVSARHLGVQPPRSGAEALGRASACCEHASTGFVRVHSRLFVHHPQLGRGDALHPQLDIDAVEKRPGDSVEVAPAGGRAAGAIGVPRTILTEGARVRGHFMTRFNNCQMSASE